MAAIAAVLHAVGIGLFMLMVTWSPVTALTEMGRTALSAIGVIFRAYGLVLVSAGVTILLAVTGRVMAVAMLEAALVFTVVFDHYLDREFSGIWALIFIAVSQLFARYLKRLMEGGNRRFDGLHIVSMVPAMLWGTCFSGADLSGADFSGADLSGADFSHSRHPIKLTDVRRPNEPLNRTYFGVSSP